MDELSRSSKVARRELPELPEIRDFQAGQPWPQLDTALRDYGEKRAEFYAARKANGDSPAEKKRFDDSFDAARAAFEKVGTEASPRRFFKSPRVYLELRAQLKTARRLVAATERLVAKGRQVVSLGEQVIANPRYSNESPLGFVQPDSLRIHDRSSRASIDSTTAATLGGSAPLAAASTGVARQGSTRPADEPEELATLIAHNNDLLARLDGSRAESTPAPERSPQRRRDARSSQRPDGPVQTAAVEAPSHARGVPHR